MNTAERLWQYNPAFNPEVVGIVADVADYQRRFANHKEYFAAIGLPEPTTEPATDYSSVSVLDLVPRQDFDETHARLIRLPMANPLDSNMLMQVASISQTDPSVRWIAIGNPGDKRHPAGDINRREARRWMAKGRVEPLVEPALRILGKRGIRSMDQIGWSLGAEIVAGSGLYSSAMRQMIGKAIMIEPVTVKHRSLLGLGLAFKSTEKALAGYVDAVEVPALKTARQEAKDQNNYMAGLLRPTNVAIARMLTRKMFKHNLEESLSNQPDMTAHIIWGTKDELADDILVREAVADLQDDFGDDRVRAMRLKGQKHALVDDIHLKDAIILDCLLTA